MLKSRVMTEEIWACSKIVCYMQWITVLYLRGLPRMTQPTTSAFADVSRTNIYRVCEPFGAFSMRASSRLCLIRVISHSLSHSERMPLSILDRLSIPAYLPFRVDAAWLSGMAFLHRG